MEIDYMGNDKAAVIMLVKYAFQKSPLTDEYCERLAELYKISKILKQPRYCSDYEGFKNYIQ